MIYYIKYDNIYIVIYYNKFKENTTLRIIYLIEQNKYIYVNQYQHCFFFAINLTANFIEQSKNLNKSIC